MKQLYYIIWYVILNVIMNRISEFQLAAGRSVIRSYETEDKPWHLLFAQPQSGKTDTFYFVGAEMLRMEKVKQVIILCGASDIQLRNQCVQSLCNSRGGMDFCEKYDSYLESELGLNREERFNIKSNIKMNVNYIWGHDLINEHSYKDNTLFIWDESHYAQTISMRPFKFFEKMGISCDGEKENLNRDNNFVLSVSATPFAEISYIMREIDPKKGKTFLETDENYCGISDAVNKGLLIPFDINKLNSELTKILKKENEEPSYGIIRVFNEDNSRCVEEIAKKCGWNKLRCNSDSKKRDISNLSLLKIRPETNTLIIIKGMCRMGQVIEKTNISFVMETSQDSNSETVIQGLLGRTLGWHNSSIMVYISNKIFKRGDMRRYVELLKGGNILPKRSKNLKGKLKNEEPVAETNECDVFSGRKTKPVRENNIVENNTRNPKGKKKRKLLVIQN
jgi:hypothetical protein